MSSDRTRPDFASGQRWGFLTRFEEFQRELVIVGTGENEAVGRFFEVAVPFAPGRSESHRHGGALVAVTPDGLAGSVVALLEEGLAPSDVRHELRLPGSVLWTEGTVDDGLAEYLAALRWERQQQREAGEWTLTTAIDQGDLDEVRRELVREPGKLNGPISDEQRDPPLAYAARRGQTEIVRFLLDEGADATAAGEGGMTPLHYAAAEGHGEIARLLLTRGAEVGALDAAGRPPLLVAARSHRPGCARVAQLLEDHGAAIDLQALVCLGRFEDVRRRLEAIGESPSDTPFPESLVEDVVVSIQSEIRRRSIPGIIDRPAIDAVLEEALPVLELVLRWGADPNAGDPLLTAVQIPDTRVARLLLEHGADPNKDVTGGRFLPELASDEEMKALLAEFGAVGRNDPEQVIARANADLADNPEDVEALKARAAANARCGRWAEALADYAAVLPLDPEDPQVYNDRAWIWATCPDEAFRDGSRAVESAARAVALDGGSTLMWDQQEGRAFFRVEYRETLAAAHAEAGNFEAAVSVLDEALAIASPADRPRLLYRRALFAAGTPYRDVPGANDPALYEGIDDPFAEKKSGVWRRLLSWFRRRGRRTGE